MNAVERKIKALETSIRDMEAKLKDMEARIREIENPEPTEAETRLYFRRMARAPEPERKAMLREWNRQQRERLGHGTRGGSLQGSRTRDFRRK